MDDKDSGQQNRLIGGIILILIGALALFAQFFNSDWLTVAILLTLGVAFLLWGAISRRSGLFVPGGVLTGVGLGIATTGGGLDLAEDSQAGAFMLAFALGWLLIPIFSAIFTPERHLWALIPAGIIAFIGVALLFGGVAEQALKLLGRVWPLILILIGIGVLMNQRRGARQEKIKEKSPADLE